MDEEKIKFFRYDFQLGRQWLREVAQLAVMDFQEKGGQITVCRPAFAMGCEMKSNVRQAIRKEF